MTLLWALLSSKKLKPAEAKAFQYMYDDLRNGKIVSLSKKQRDWVTQRFNDLDLKLLTTPAPPMSKKAGSVQTYDWEKNKPLKPPGRS
jgi:hypothetical protein